MAESDRGSTGRTLRAEVSFWSTWVFGTLISAVGTISFIQHVFGVHLIPTYAHGLEIYRVVVHTFVGWLYWPFLWLVQYVSLNWLHFPLRITIPGWWKDLATVSSAIVAIENRANHIYWQLMTPRGWRWKPDLYLDRVKPLLRLVIEGLTLFGFIIALRIILITVWPPNHLAYTATRLHLWRIFHPLLGRGYQPFRIRANLMALLGAFSACIVFFVTNAYNG